MTETLEKRNTPETTGSHTRQWLVMTRIACLLVLLWAVALNLVAGELIPEVLAIGLVFGLFALFTRGNRPKLGLVTAILGVVALTGNLPGTIDELSHPSSAPAFTLTLLVVVAAAGVIFSGTAAFFRLSPDPIRAISYSGAAIFIVGVLVALNAAASVESVQPEPTDVQVVAEGVDFDQTEVVVQSGDSGFWLDNRDGIRHTLTIAGTGYEIDAPGLSAQRAEFELAPGEYEIFCAVPGHENMRIDLIVEG